MKPPCVWFNKHLSNTFEVIALLTEARRAGEFRVICTHPRGSHADRLDCDIFAKEPIGLSDEDYVRFCLDFAQRHRVTVFFPGRKVRPIMHAAPRFRAIGVRLAAAADVDTLALMQSKARVYEAAADLDIRVPAYEVVHDLAGFDAAWARLHARHPLLCYKPDSSVFGIGFHIVADVNSTKTAHESSVNISLHDARCCLEHTARRRDLMLMQYLPGPERSVDCLARNGALLRCVVRRKMDGGQMIEVNPQIEAAVRRLTARFGLTNLFNVQFRDAGSTHYLLEINPRMSGGLPFACQSGLAFPLWAIRLMLGTIDAAEIPWPRAGVWVTQPELVSSL